MGEERSSDDVNGADSQPDTNDKSGTNSVDSGRPAVDNPFSDSTETGPASAGDTPTGSSSAGGTPTVSPSDDDVPFADLAAETRTRRRRAGERADDDPFEEMDVGALDDENAWESLADADADGRAAPGGAATRVGETDDRPEHVVSKREYCQRCRHFSDPPAVECGHDGTDIVEAVDSDQFRVRGCPMVSDDGAPDFDNP